ncbi:MAG: FCD domain-containing protein [Hyphomicrobiales bacterium]|nr:FCD domain-containing protein [Hyphomicrobiales bacterium]MCP5371004.1 FCD domain-containing protein [Hyphomicrobiales bacterium]
MSESRQTRAEAAYALLRGEILNGNLAPGARLRAAALRAAYGLGLTPIREACARLAAEHLVEARGQRGFAVAPVSAAELGDLIDLRRHLETAALERAIARGGDAWEEGLVAAFHALAKVPVPRAGDQAEATAAWERAHNRFHGALIGPGGSPWMSRVRAQLDDQMARYRRLLMFQTAGAGNRLAAEILAAHAELLHQALSPAEHRAIMAAALDRDAARACDLMSTHLRRTAHLFALLGEAVLAA